MPSVHLTSMMNTKIWNLNFLALNCLPIMYVQFLDLLQFCYILKDKPPTWRPHQFCRDRMFGSVGHLEYYVYDFSVGKLVCHFFSPKKYFGFYFDCIEEQSKATLNPSDTLGKASFFYSHRRLSWWLWLGWGAVMDCAASGRSAPFIPQPAKHRSEPLGLWLLRPNGPRVGERCDSWTKGAIASRNMSSWTWHTLQLPFFSR